MTTTASIYDRHDAAFRRVAAYAIAQDGRHVANVKIKFPEDGAGRLYAYVHWLGSEMVRGYAGGYGYDKSTAAVSAAAHKLADVLARPVERYKGDTRDHAAGFLAAITPDGGATWHDRVRAAGFDVWQVV